MYCTDRDVDNGFISLLNALVDDFGQIHGFMDKRIDIVLEYNDLLLISIVRWTVIFINELI